MKNGKKSEDNKHVIYCASETMARYGNFPIPKSIDGQDNYEHSRHGVIYTIDINLQVMQYQIVNLSRKKKTKNVA